MTSIISKQDQRVHLQQLLGGWPKPSQAGANCVQIDQQTGFSIEHLRLVANRVTPYAPVSALPALFIKPDGIGPFPAVLYCHAHGGQYSIGKQELLDGRPALPGRPYAQKLADAGFAVLCIDQPCFGERSDISESFLAKQLLWHGDTLFGMMLRELATAVDYLQTRADIDAKRIATCGISMGATTAWWLAALDERISAVAQLCCFADIGSLIRHGLHDRHGIYMTVPGLVKHYTTADIARLIIPRPHLICAGLQDSLTPPEAFHGAVDSLQQHYNQAGVAGALEVLIDANSGHLETPAMRLAVLRFLQKQLL